MSAITPYIRLNTTTEPYTESSIPDSAKEYIALAKEAKTYNPQIQVNNRNLQRLSIAYVTVLTGIAFIPAGLPVLAVGMIFTTVVAGAIAYKLMMSKKQLQNKKFEFAQKAFEFERLIFQKVLVELSTILKDQYDIYRVKRITPSNQWFAQKTLRVNSYRWKENVDINAIRDRLLEWSEQFRFVHAYEKIEGRVHHLPYTFNPRTEHHFLFNHLHSFYDNTGPDTLLNNIFRSVEAVINQ